MANINSKNTARKKVREAQARANEAQLERERLNVDDAASLLVELGRLAAVDEWEQGRVAEIHAEGERRRHEHRQEGAAALCVDPAVHAGECRRFDSYEVKGSEPDDCDFFTRAIGTDSYRQN